MRLTRLIRLLTICSAIGAADAGATVVSWLYDIEVPVSSQNDVERQRAASIALAELLTRLTGLRELPPHPAVSEALRLPTQFYSRFEFARRRLDRAGDASAVPPVAADTVLIVHFDPTSVLALLRDAELPIWPADRPTILLWLAVEDQGERSIVSASTPELAAALTERARRRGLQLALPLMDLQDRQLSPTDILGGFREAVDAASARYAPDMLLVGRAQKTADGRWRSDWQLRTWRTARPIGLYMGTAVDAPFSAGDSFDGRFDQQAETTIAAAQEAIDRAADALAGRFAARGDLRTIAVTVSGGQTVRGYASLLRYLNSREYIERVEVAVVRPDAFLLRVHSRSSVEQLRELLPMGGSMTVVPGGASDSLSFAWTGTK